ncbi:hypothetical protein VCR26J2_270053 [Vibrio coralliirubri]|uniref:hypothetical protein n=1 Tax=Vibrio coralliirubri TaxID=1516159 RepID=UPI00062F08DF|nr:hypothetical protein [Vibrio coralliirubri]CDT61089.1 hypothetical protein VCR26J2_270053 [Vibrio coralliirubri]
MVDIKKRIAAAKARMKSRHKDKDKEEVTMMVSSFKGLSPEEIRKNFEKAIQDSTA